MRSITAAREGIRDGGEDKIYISLASTKECWEQISLMCAWQWLLLLLTCGAFKL